MGSKKSGFAITADSDLHSLLTITQKLYNQNGNNKQLTQTKINALMNQKSDAKVRWKTSDSK